jgi:hypothetical protein
MNMEYENRPNSGVFFAVKVKKNPKSPDYTGSITIDMSTIKIVNGQAVIRLSGWKKKSKQGNTFLSLAVDNYEANAKPKEEAAVYNPSDDPFAD